MKKKVLCVIAAVVFCLAVPVGALANSAEPPCVTVLVLAPPGDLELTIEFDSAQGEEPQRLSGERMLWEGYYRFYGRWDIDPEGLTGARLVAETGGESFALPIDPTGFARYNNLITLDVGGRQLLYGQPWWRQPLLVVLRVALTLALEGRLDTTTAPQLEQEVRASLDNVTKLVMDLAELDYLSSAGLRVLLSAQKQMNRKKGRMVVCHVCEPVMEVFDMTGFSDILTIEE